MLIRFYSIDYDQFPPHLVSKVREQGFSFTSQTFIALRIVSWKRNRPVYRVKWSGDQEWIGLWEVRRRSEMQKRYWW